MSAYSTESLVMDDHIDDCRQSPNGKPFIKWLEPSCGIKKEKNGEIGKSSNSLKLDNIETSGIWSNISLRLIKGFFWLGSVTDCTLELHTHKLHRAKLTSVRLQKFKFVSCWPSKKNNKIMRNTLDINTLDNSATPN